MSEIDLDDFSPFLGIKRKILVTKIQGVTYSKMSSEFVIHIPEEYDYRYSSYDKFNNGNCDYNFS